jgi:ABC-type hemin transport system substrate-binding protein
MPPQTIVSLVPSLTELAWWFGLGDRLVGRTRFCTEPGTLRERVPALGGTKNPKVARIVELRPDLVLANKEENREEDVAALRAGGLDVLVTDPNSLEEALDMVRTLGDVLGALTAARALIRETRRAMSEQAGAANPTRAFVPVWKEPLMGLGSETYGSSVLEVAGGVNVLGGRARYPEVGLDDLAELRPQVVLLPDEPYPFKAADAAAYDGIAPARIVDGKLLWWYGPRMPSAIRELARVLREGAA